MKIHEIMTRNVITLLAETPIPEALESLFSHKISGLPVVDADRRVVGMFTEKDVLRAILPSYVSQVGRFVYENVSKTIKSKAEKLVSLKVADLMRKDVIKVLEDVPVSEAARLMLTQNVRRIPVVDAQERIVGIVARADVLKQILQR
ncbi:MAG: CBS domain-containing protein [Candidatus Omnitrophota bacterium]